MKWILTFLLCLGSMLSFAQEAGGKMRGSVLGPDFEPVMGAKVFIKKENKIIKEYITNEDGYYSSESLVPGKYDVFVVYDGCKTLQISQVPIDENLTTALDVHLEVSRNHHNDAITIKYTQPKVLCKYPAH